MAEALLSSFLEVILGNLASAAMQELRMVWGVGKELCNLESNLRVINAVVEDAVERQVDSERIRDWLQNVKYVAYDADDLTDEIVTKSRQSKTAESSTEAGEIKKKMKQQVLNIVSSCFHCSRIPHRREMAVRIREINVQLEKIKGDLGILKLRIRNQPKIMSELQPSQLVNFVRDESSPFLSREDDKEKIVNFLLSDDSSERKFSVISIVGAGGVGKTTLAGVVYNDKRIRENFEIRAWVCVSEDSSPERLTKAIIASVSSSTSDSPNFGDLKYFLRNKLNGKKILLVLDDVWSKDDRDRERWEHLQAPLTYGAKGSRIVVTTRNRVVSDFFPETSVHDLKCLSSEEDCWSLFVGRAFKDKSIDTYPGLKKIAEELVKKCGGLPLAAKALGGLLSSKREVRDWEIILRSPIWGLESNIMPALRLSYQHLPAHIKRCFTFCSVFPKDYIFDKKDLVLQWVAHGFVPATVGKQMEDTGSEYFNHLLQSSFFQLDNYDEFGEAPVRYKMHDLIHDLAQSISGDECFDMAHDKSDVVLGKARHLSYSADYRELKIFESFYESKGLRTFILINAIRSGAEKVPHDVFERLRFIRVLDLKSYKIRELPKSIGNLKHLRYLDLSESEIKELPESICSIYNLQTLLLSWCSDLVMLPNETRKLINLRHLEIEGCERLVSMPPQIGRLTCLQTLPLFSVGTARERGIAELKELTGIRGELRIANLENVAEPDDAREANLKSKPFIDYLRLMWSFDRGDSLQSEGLEEEIANGLQPHPNLKRLGFYNYLGTQFPSWMVETDMLLSNLRSLELKNCSRCSILPPLGCLPSLSELYIGNLQQVKRIGREYIRNSIYGMADGRFPSLKVLHLEEMLNLEEWQENEGACFPSLEELVIRNCPQLRQINLNPLPKLTSLEIRNCASLISLQMPLPNLTSLLIFHCASLVSLHMPLPNLTSLNIWECASLVSLPMLLPNLTSLNIRSCASLVSLQMPLPNLTFLNIWECVSLVSLPMLLPNLTSLNIRSCASLVSLQMPLPNLTSLEIRYCESLVPLQMPFPNVENCVLCCCPSFLSLPPLPSLKKLDLANMENLEEWCDVEEEACFPHLRELFIMECPNMRLEPDILPSLSALNIGSIPSLISMPWGMLQAQNQLKILRIRCCEELVTLEDEVLPLHLNELSLNECLNLKSLPRALDALTSLRHLSINNCPSITSLPEQGLPSSLERLDVQACPALRARCVESVGEDWSKISHIPDVNIWY